MTPCKQHSEIEEELNYLKELKFPELKQQLSKANKEIEELKKKNTEDYSLFRDTINRNYMKKQEIRQKFKAEQRKKVKWLKEEYRQRYVDVRVPLEMDKGVMDLIDKAFKDENKK